MALRFPSIFREEARGKERGEGDLSWRRVLCLRRLRPAPLGALPPPRRGGPRLFWGSPAAPNREGPKRSFSSRPRVPPAALCPAPRLNDIASSVAGFKMRLCESGIGSLEWCLEMVICAARMWGIVWQLGLAELSPDRRSSLNCSVIHCCWVLQARWS